MTKISQYSTDVNITGNDKWIGSDAQNFLITKNFTPNNLANYFNENNVIDIGTSIRYRYQTLLPGEAREQGTISFETEIGPQVNFSAITTFLIAKNSLKQNDVSQYLDFLVDGKVLLSKASNINIFGYYKITSIEPWIPNTNFFVVEVDFLAGNGFIYEDLDYLVSLVDKVQDIPPPVWGSITGDIEDQTDLINYISSQITIPTLQSVTDDGSTTTNSITVAGITSGNFVSDGYNVTISDSNDGIYNFYYVPYSGLFIGNGVDTYTQLGNDASIGFQTTVGIGNLRSDLVTGSRIWQLPNATGILALVSDIPTLTSQLTNDVPFLTQDNVVEYPDLASFPVTGVIGTIYIALDTEDFYLWNGVTYVLTTPPNTGITGVGTTNTYAKFTSPTTIGNGRFVDGPNGGIYTFGSQWINLINGGSVLTLNRSQSSMDFTLGVPNALPTTIASTQNQEGLHITSVGDFVLKSGNPLAIVYNVNRANRNLHIGASTDTDYATQKLQVTGNLRVTGAVYDSNNSAGTSGQILSSTATGTDWIDPTGSGGIPHGTAAGTDTYTVTISGVTAYADGDAYIIRFTNGNTTVCTLNINSLGAITLYRNNNGALIGGDIVDGGDMLCVYDSAINGFRVIGTAPNTLLAYVTNDDSVTLTKGMPVYAFSGTGDRMTVKRAYNTSDATSAQTVGLVLSTSIAANQKGLIIIQGLLDGLSILPTATFDDGDAIYLGATPGTITNIKPYAPNHLVYLGVVTTASNGAAGRMYVRVQNGYELQELHNVQAQTPSLNDTLWYDNTVSPAQWKTASIPTILGYTPPNLGLVQAMTQGLQNIF